MTAHALGHGGTQSVILTMKNTGTTDISRGHGVELKSTSERYAGGPDDYVPNGGSALVETGSLSLEIQRRATAAKTIGVALAAIPVGHWGPVVLVGLAPIMAKSAIAVGDAVAFDLVDVYKFKKAVAATDIANNNAVGLAVVAASGDGVVAQAFVNFLHTISANSGFGGAAT